MQFTNRNDISPLLAVWLAKNEYVLPNKENLVSATTLLKSLRQIVLARKYKDLNKVVDVSDLVAARMGTALHDSIEKAWTTDETTIKAILAQFGLSEEALETIKINPDPSTVTESMIPIYIEQRNEKDVTLSDGSVWTISGAYDAVMNGRVFDYKSTSVWTHIYGSNDDKYAKQGSIYRWQVPEIITEDVLQVEHIFTDWSGVKALQDKKYPQSRILSKVLPLMSIRDTEIFVKDKLEEINRFMKLDEEKLPLCTDEELWREKDTYKYYKDPSKVTGRSTANFESYAEANERLLKDKSVGTIIKYPGGVKACRYCAVQNVCSQYKTLKLSNQIKE